MATGFKLPRCYAGAHQEMSAFAKSLMPEGEAIPFAGFRPRTSEMMRAQDEPLAVFKPSVSMMNRWRQISSFGEGIRWRAFDTTVYHYPHADLSPQYPGVNEKTEAVVVAFSGSGLTSASGRNFMQLANVMARRGVSLVSLDYPFHREGPRDTKYMNADFFHQTMMELVKFYKSSGLPIFLMGHSQGPLPIQELLFMDPALVSAAIMFSPGGASSRELLKHYLQQDAAGAFDSILSAKTQVDNDAEGWEMAMDEQAKTTDLNAMPTKIPVWIIAGDDDPWSSPDMIRALAAKYPKGMANIIPGAGHNTFHARFPNGKALMATRMIEMIEGVLDRKLPKLPKISAPSKALYCYKNSEMFRGWLEAVEDRGIEVLVSDTNAAKDLLERWNFWLTSAMFEIFSPRPELPKRPSRLSLKIWFIHTTEEMHERDAFKATWTANHVNQALKVFGQATENRG